jgi:threonine aldolase
MSASADVGLSDRWFKSFRASDASQELKAHRMLPRSIDLRSDTVTKPTPGMRQAIADAEVGDDMVGEDPTVNRLEARMCELLGKPAAVFGCSGTQTNQMGVRALCHPGDELLIEESGHIANWEAGGPAVLSGVTVRTIKGHGGMLSVENLTGKIRPGNQHYCITRLVCLENTTNHGGGRVYPRSQAAAISRWAREHGLKMHLDGARLFNACLVGGYSPSDFCSLFDTVSVCFSKGLGCPMGSMLVGEVDVIQRARRTRKLLGGAMRQAGMMAAAALYALDHHVDRLAVDHEHATAFARALAEVPGVQLNPAEVESNLVFFSVDPGRGSAAEVATRLKAEGVLVYALGEQRIRACTHLDVDRPQLMEAVKIVDRVLNGARQTVAVGAGVSYGQG